MDEEDACGSKKPRTSEVSDGIISVDDVASEVCLLLSSSVIVQKSVRNLTKREPFGANHSFARQGGKYHLLIGISGSVASIKLPELIAELRKRCPPDRLVIRLMSTESAKYFISEEDVGQPIYDDADEWNMWKKRGDPILHIELRKWADALLIAPLDANTLAKIANGLCDNLLTCVVRAWDMRKTLFFAPAMNTAMWESPITYEQRKTLKEFLRFKEIPVLEKELMCGERGYGAMATVQMISTMVASDVKSRFAVYSDSNPTSVQS
ncbi:unnamed protein product [Anisakis simplex]|uniref:Flavoprotein domain-containing protein n=1 Tax=Anisakis simplex TaxID=6269 RepID=A0A0M3JS97_ANISI|nr:unnamed protein product [Anisakis simplex]